MAASLVTTRWRVPPGHEHTPGTVYPKVSFHFRSLAVTQPGLSTPSWGKPGAWGGWLSRSPRGGPRVPTPDPREQGGGLGRILGTGFLEGKMTFHCNWGSCRKPEGAGGGNVPTSRAAGPGGGVQGRAEQGLQGARPALLSLPRPCHRHEGSPAEMTVLVPAWSPNVRIPEG